MTDHVRIGPKPEGRCEIVWFSVPGGPPYYASAPYRAVAQCMTHQWSDVPGVSQNIPARPDNPIQVLCPIGLDRGGHGGRAGEDQGGEAMSTTKSKETLTRLAWITELRRQGERQCIQYYHGPNAEVCALGLLAEVAGVTIADHLDSADKVGALAGLSEHQSYEVTARNDGGCVLFPANGILTEYRKHTFAEIADVVASWFPND